MKAFVYCVVGDVRYKKESLYSIKSLLKRQDATRNECKIIVVTDRKDAYGTIANWPNVIIEEVDTQLIKEWSLDYTYYVRCKIKCLEYCFERYECDLLFVDTDTIVLQDISYAFDHIKEGVFYMHSACTPINKALDIIAQTRFKDISYLTLQRIHFYSYMREKNFIFNDKYPIDVDFVPHNSGIIGIAYKNRDILKTVLEVCDLIFQRFQYQCAEEFALSYVLQNAGKVRLLENMVFHYPEAKFTRYLMGSILDFYAEGDKEEADGVLLALGIKNIKAMNLSLDDIPYLVRMLLVYSSDATKDLKLSSLEEVFTYVDKDSEHYKEHNSAKKFKVYYKKMKQLQ